MFEADGIVLLALFAFWVYCILDVIATDNSLCRNLPKISWLFLVLMLPEIGGVAWLLLGRPEKAGYRPGDTDYRKPMIRPRGPEDSPGFAEYLRSTRPSRPDEDTPKSENVDAVPPSALGEGLDVRSAPTDDPIDEAKRRDLADRETDLKRRELAAWEAELAEREAKLKNREEGGGQPLL
jgi:Phospholipase_D-nuclease N-terminal